MNLFEVSKEIADRLTRMFLRDEQGRRPIYGGTETFQKDPHWRDNILFNEYFHGDSGAGLGASHQTGWTGVVATLIQLFGSLDAQRALEGGKVAAFTSGTPEGEVKNQLMAETPGHLRNQHLGLAGRARAGNTAGPLRWHRSRRLNGTRSPPSGSMRYG